LDGTLPQPVDRPCFGTSVNASKEKKSINKENMATMHFGEKEVYDRLIANIAWQRVANRSHFLVSKSKKNLKWERFFDTTATKKVVASMKVGRGRLRRSSPGRRVSLPDET
jgi:hypothetical protein